MSYILDALKKSESERSRGASPEFASSQIIMTSKKQTVSPWVIIFVFLLVINLCVVGYFVSSRLNQTEEITLDSDTHAVSREPLIIPPSVPADSVVSNVKVRPEAPLNYGNAPLQPSAATVPAHTGLKALDSDVVGPHATAFNAEGNNSRATEFSAPQIIRPRQKFSEGSDVGQIEESRVKKRAPVQAEIAVDEPPSEDSLHTSDQRDAVPSLSEFDRDFQKSIPNLTFNSHIYASNATRRRIMINNQYLSQGQFIEGLRIEDITEEGVILSKDGTSFSLSVVRNWSFQ